VNKTPLFRETNQIVGGVAPSTYLEKLQKELDAYAVDSAVEVRVEDVLTTHCIDPDTLKADDFDTFYSTRKEALAQLIEAKTGVKVVRGEGRSEKQEADDIEMAVT
jgi:hypothetical protein